VFYRCLLLARSRRSVEQFFARKPVAKRFARLFDLQPRCTAHGWHCKQSAHLAEPNASATRSQSSTVQILGAEKALFRALKTRGNTPKYGLIFHSTFIGRAKQRNKGRISR